MVRFALLLVFCLGFCSSADAQWLRGKRASVSSSCPNGECPTQVTQAAPEVRGHWSYPGTIDSHLESTHGVATAGMTRQQKLDLHDSLHEGTAKSNYQSVGYSVGYGSSGYKSCGSSGSRAYGSNGGSGGYGSSGSSFRVGGRDIDGRVISSIGPVGKPVFSVQPVPSAAPKATCACGEKCQCNAGGGKCPCGDDMTSWSRPNLDFATESLKQYYVRREDVESIPAI